MDIKSKAHIILTAGMTAAETFAAARHATGFEAAVLDAAQAEAVKDPTGMAVVSRGVTFADDGSATVTLVYEQATPVQSASEPVAQSSETAAQDGAAPPVPPAPSALPGIMIPSATA